MVTVVRRLIGAAFSIFILSACGYGTPKSSTPTAVAESSYCSTTYPTTTPITVTAQANYFYRATNIATGLTGDPVSRGIAFAEVIVTNSAGEIIQCSNTNATGGISFQIDKAAGTYTITVNSRAYNSALKASVLSDPTSNAVYSISSSFSLTGAEASPYASGVTLHAYARVAQSPSLVGAAFHILYDLYLANDYIRTQTSTPSFVADKVTAYWKQGFNPGTYVGVSSGLSFYMQGQHELYILGGTNGNTKTADTDHFDDSVIIHEYGHFLEDVYGKSASPGGSHNGNFIIDPRLAWSEGWANFLQGAVVTPGDATRGHYYIDTFGYSADSSETGESGALAIRFDLSQAGGTASTDAVSVAGEGTFRELSISRTLYKVITTTSIPFSSIWTVFTDAVNGMRAPANVFSNIGFFNMNLNLLVSAGAQMTAWNGVLSDEKQNKTTADYADPVTLNAGCAKYPKAMSPVVDSAYSSGDDRSNKLRSNDFYQYYYDGSGGTLQITYSQTVATGSGEPNDLDLYLYYPTYSYQEDALEAQGQSTGGVAKKSDRIQALDGGTESISLAGLSSGYYLINVKAQTYGKTTSQVNGTVSYTLTYQGTKLCPQN